MCRSDPTSVFTPDGLILLSFASTAEEYSAVEVVLIILNMSNHIFPSLATFCQIIHILSNV